MKLKMKNVVIKRIENKQINSKTFSFITTYSYFKEIFSTILEFSEIMSKCISRIKYTIKIVTFIVNLKIFMFKKKNLIY